ncbi:MAG: hypothetical protein VKP72_14730 [bacterium]|nr:hypothetical protein [bacterium]
MVPFTASRILCAGVQLNGLRDQARANPLGLAQGMLVGRPGLRVQVSLFEDAGRTRESWTLEKLASALDEHDVAFLLESLGLDEAAVAISGGIGLAEIAVKRPVACPAYIALAS